MGGEKGVRREAQITHLELFIIGEVKKGKVTGFHNWIRFYLQEKEGLVDYYSYIYDGPVSTGSGPLGWKPCYTQTAGPHSVFRTVRPVSHPDPLKGAASMTSPCVEQQVELARTLGFPSKQ